MKLIKFLQNLVKAARWPKNPRCQGVAPKALGKVWFGFLQIFGSFHLGKEHKKKNRLRIKDHILLPQTENPRISYKITPNHSGEFKNNLPDIIILHYTAGSSLQSSADWLCNPESKASAHVIIGKSGNIIQLAPFNFITWHAGKSKWKDRTNLNNYSIGIELDNAGQLEKREDGYYTWFNKKIDKKNVKLAKHKFDEEIQPWDKYTKIQLEVLEELCKLLSKTYNIKQILGHDDISPDRKRDPGPAFPLQQLQKTSLKNHYPNLQ